MARRNYIRRIFAGFGVLLLLLILLTIALPLWFPWVLRPVLEKYNVQFSEFKRDGYTRLLLEDVKFSTKNAEFQARKIELMQPTSWLWTRYVGGDRKVDYGHVTSWRLVVSKRETKGKKTPAESVAKIEKVFDEIKRWLPQARFSE